MRLIVFFVLGLFQVLSHGNAQSNNKTLEANFQAQSEEALITFIQSDTSLAKAKALTSEQKKEIAVRIQLQHQKALQERGQRKNQKALTSINLAILLYE